MATQADVRRIALTLPASHESTTDFAFGVDNKGKSKGFAWVWKERIDPKKARVPNHAVLAVRVRDLSEKELLLAADPDKFFTEPHYNGFPAILVRLAAVSVPELRKLLADAWHSQAPRTLLEPVAASPRRATKPRTSSRAKSPASSPSKSRAKPPSKSRSK